MPNSQKLPKWRIVNLLVEHLGQASGIDPNARLISQLVNIAQEQGHKLSKSSLLRWSKEGSPPSSFQVDTAEALAAIFQKGCPEICASWFQKAGSYEEFEALLQEALNKARPRQIPDVVEAAYRLIRPHPFFGPKDQRLVVETSVVWHDADGEYFALFSPVYGEHEMISRIAYVGTRRKIGDSIILEGTTASTEIKPYNDCFVSLHAKHEAPDPQLNNVRALTYHGFDAFSGDPWCGLCFSHKIADGDLSVAKVRDHSNFSEVPELRKMYGDAHVEIERFLTDSDGQSASTLHLQTALFNQLLGYLQPLEGDFYKSENARESWVAAS